MQLIGNKKKNTMNGGSEDDTIDGMAGNDKLFGWGGNDTLIGGKGVDTLNGGDGDDQYVVRIIKKGSGSKIKPVLEDKIIESSGIDTLVLTDFVKLKVTRDFILDSALENLDSSSTGATKLNLVGNSNNNILIGNDFSNAIFGGEGQDTLIGGAGSDTLIGGSGRDFFVVDSNQLSIPDFFSDFSSVDDVIRLDGNLFSPLGSGVFFDMLTFGNSAQDSNDFLIYDNSSGSLFFDSNANGSGGQVLIASFNPGQSLNVLNFSNSILRYQPKTIVGTSTNDSLDGGFGDDTIDGLSGIDTLYGGYGNDTYILDQALDVVLEFGTDESDTVVVGFSESLNQLKYYGIENLSLSGTGNYSAIGSASDNKLSGNLGNNMIDGLGGNDTLTGGNGNDQFKFSWLLNPTTNVDTITDFNANQDKILLDLSVFSNIRLYLEASEFRIGNAALDSNDRIIFNPSTGGLFYDSDGSGSDSAIKFANLQTIQGSLNYANFEIVNFVTDNSFRSGNDTITGDNDDNGIFGDWGGYNGDDTYYGFGGNDRFFEGTFNSGLYESGNDTMYGGDGNDTLYGGIGDDFLVGESGNDQLGGDYGQDTLDGGAGFDIFDFTDVSYESPNNVDTIVNFETSEDKIYLSLSFMSNLEFDSFNRSLLASNFVTGSQALDSNDHIIFDSSVGELYYDPDGSGVISQVKFATISSLNGTLSESNFKISSASGFQAF